MDRAAMRKAAGHTYTIERGRGATYNNGRWTVYAHGTYPRSSVLWGQPSRTWVQDYDSLEAAQAAHPQATTLDDGGTTYVDIDRLTAHLPDTPDW